MLVDDLHVVRCGIYPSEANSELIVYSDAVLSIAIATQRFKAISRGHTEVMDMHSDLQLSKLSTSDRFNVPKTPNWLTAGQRLRFGTAERRDHRAIVTYRVITVNPGPF